MTSNGHAPVLWKANTSRHDWRTGAPLQRLIDIAARLRLIGQPEQITPDLPSKERILAAPPGDALATAVIAACAHQGRVGEITLSGNTPAPWELFWNVYPFDSEEGWVDGMNTLWLTFDRARVPDRFASDTLLEGFFAAHTPADTEYAVIHPYDHWSDFSDLAYQIPVTINLMFRGVFWATFLGPGHIEAFDPTKLRDLDAYAVRWVGTDGLFVVATPDLASADAPAAEPVLLSLTQRFRDALRPQSRWR